ncbi:MAG: hypothetical protein NUV81_02515 [bacterium]|nr:hypothetical protein [bacterium]
MNLPSFEDVEREVRKTFPLSALGRLKEEITIQKMRFVSRVFISLVIVNLLCAFLVSALGLVRLCSGRLVAVACVWFALSFFMWVYSRSVIRREYERHVLEKIGIYLVNELDAYLRHSDSVLLADQMYRERLQSYYGRTLGRVENMIRFILEVKISARSNAEARKYLNRAYDDAVGFAQEFEWRRRGDQRRFLLEKMARVVEQRRFESTSLETGSVADVEDGLDTDERVESLNDLSQGRTLH